MAKKNNLSIVPSFVVSNELIIAESQLERLSKIAMERLLTPDETKQYDILVKNIMLIRGQPTVINGTSTQIVEELEEAELVQIAQLPSEEKKEDTDGQTGSS